MLVFQRVMASLCLLYYRASSKFTSWYAAGVNSTSHCKRGCLSQTLTPIHYFNHKHLCMPVTDEVN